MIELISIINLIRFHVEGDNEEFEKLAMAIAEKLYKDGLSDTALYIKGLFSDANVIIPQEK